MDCGYGLKDRETAWTVDTDLRTGRQHGLWDRLWDRETTRTVGQTVGQGDNTDCGTEKQHRLCVGQTDIQNRLWDRQPDSTDCQDRQTDCGTDTQTVGQTHRLWDR